MKLSKHLRLLKHLHNRLCFTIKDVVRVTDSNNPYRTVEHLKEHINLDAIDVRKGDIGFRVYYIAGRDCSKRAALSMIGRMGWRVAA